MDVAGAASRRRSSGGNNVVLALCCERSRDEEVRSGSVRSSLPLPPLIRKTAKPSGISTFSTYCLHRKRVPETLQFGVPVPWDPWACFKVQGAVEERYSSISHFHFQTHFRFLSLRHTFPEAFLPPFSGARHFICTSSAHPVHCAVLASTSTCRILGFHVQDSWLPLPSTSSRALPSSNSTLSTLWLFFGFTRCRSLGLGRLYQ